MLLSARKIILLHFLMRLPDFVKPVVAAADRFLQRIQEQKLFLAVSCLAMSRPVLAASRPSVHRRRWRTSMRLPRSEPSHAG